MNRSMLIFWTLLLWATSARSIDIERYVLQQPSVFCEGASLGNASASVCELDLAKLASGMCAEQVVIHKVIHFASCGTLANPPVRTADLLKVMTNDQDRVAVAVLAAASSARLPPPPNLSPLGPYMPKSLLCGSVAAALVERPPGPGFLNGMDNGFPGWRGCMDQFAANMLAGIPNEPQVTALRRLETVIRKIDLSQPANLAKAKKFVLAVETEPSTPTFDRLMLLLGSDW